VRRAALLASAASLAAATIALAPVGANASGPSHVGGGARASSHRHSCRVPAGHRPLAHTPRLVLWKVERPGKPESPSGEVPATTTAYACVPPRGPTRLIAHAGRWLEDVERITRLRAAGSTVGVVLDAGGKSGSSKTLIVDEVSSGRRFTLTLSSEASAYGGGSGEQQILELEQIGTPVGFGVAVYVVGAGGDVAWVGRTVASPLQPSLLVLYLHDERETRIVAVASQITGLSFRGSLLTWNAAGIVQSTQVREQNR
jgi:hypothetical protein